MSDRDVWDISVDDLPDDTPWAPVPQQPDQWYLSIEGTVRGPYLQRDIYSWVQNNSLSWDTLASRGRSDSWRTLRDIEDFRDPKRPYGGTPPPPPEWLNGPQQQRSQGQLVDTTKSPILAGILNLFTNGIGYIYLGQTTKGLVVFLLSTPVALFFIFITLGWGALVWWLVYVAAAVDAYKIGQKLQRGEAIEEWEFFPS